MPAAAPLTKFNHIIDAINMRLNAGNSITASEEFWLNGIKRDAEKLLKADASQGHIALAALMQLQWDEEKANYHIRCAKTASQSLTVKTQEVAIRSNFGRFSEVHHLLDETLDPRNGFFLENYHAALSSGAFQKLATNQRKAAEMNMDLSHFPTRTVEKIDRVLSEAGVPDEVAAHALDVGGQLLRENKLFWVGESVDIEIDDAPGHQPTVFLTFRIKESPKKAASMTFDLYERLLKAHPDHPSCLNIGFRAVPAK